MIDYYLSKEQREKFRDSIKMDVPPKLRDVKLFMDIHRSVQERVVYLTKIWEFVTTKVISLNRYHKLEAYMYSLHNECDNSCCNLFKSSTFKIKMAVAFTQSPDCNLMPELSPTETKRLKWFNRTL